MDKLFLMAVTAGNIHDGMTLFQLWLRHRNLRKAPGQLHFYRMVYAQEMQVSRQAVIRKQVSADPDIPFSSLRWRNTRSLSDFRAGRLLQVALQVPLTTKPERAEKMPN
jgi:hypothetical protein